MLVVLADGIKKGDFYTLPDGTENGVFPVILTEDYKYQYAEYMLVPARTKLNERMAFFLRMIER